MESADLRDGDDPATWRGFDDSWLGAVVVKRLMWPRGVVVGEIRAQDAAEMGAVQNDDVIEARLAAGPRPGRGRGTQRPRSASDGERDTGDEPTLPAAVEGSTGG
jgi:hypothetical protein